MKAGHTQGDVCRKWFLGLEAAGYRFYVPEIADYELRRELLRVGKTASLRRLDAFNEAEPDRYLPLTTRSVRRAAELWAAVRNAGRTTASPDALDGDVLIAAQAEQIIRIAQGSEGTLLIPAVVATANVSHLSALTNAVLWSDITL